MNKCFFCKYNAVPDYKDVDNLVKFITQRMKMVSREKSNNCAKHQRALNKEIKYARFLSLVPYISYHGLR